MKNLKNYITLTSLLIILFLTNNINVMSQLTCYVGGTPGSREDSDAVHNNQNGYVRSDFNWINHGDGTADFELTSFTYWSWLTPKYYDIQADTFYHVPGFVFAISYALTYLLPDTMFEGEITVHFASCWKTEWELLDSIPWTYERYCYCQEDTMVPYDSVMGYYRERISPCNFDNCCSVTFLRELGLINAHRSFSLTLQSLNLDSSMQCPSSSPDSCYNVCKSAFWPETSIDFHWIQSTFPPYGWGRFIIDLPGLGSPYRINTSDDLLHFDNSITVQPNPAQDKLNIKFVTPVNGNYSYNIYDYQGNFIESIKIASKNRVLNYELDISKYTEGVYFIKGNDVGSASKTVSFVVIK
jgi:hypothetical protein